MARVAPWRTVRLACRYALVRVPTRRSPSCRAGTANWASVRTASLPPARRGYGYGSGSAVADGTAGVPVRACQGSYAPLPVLPGRYGKLDGQQAPEHDTKRATQPIFVNLARALECQDRRKTAPSAALKKPRRFPSLAARFFTICLNSKKSRRS